MEAAGLAIGVGGLATSFATCVDCFEYVDIGRNFGGDFGKCLLRLDVAKLRMIQWGESVGLAPQHTPESLTVNLSRQEARIANELFEQIQDSFERAEKLSKTYKSWKERSQVASAGALDAYNPITELEPVDKHVHSTVQELAKRRQLTTSLPTKARWALYEKKKFTSLISDIDIFVSDLLELVPASRDRQAAICKADIGKFDDLRCLKALRQVTPEDDSILKEAVAHRMNSTGHTFSDFEVDGKARFHFGDRNYAVEGKSHKASHFTLKGDSDGWIGNENHSS